MRVAFLSDLLGESDQWVQPTAVFDGRRLVRDQRVEVRNGCIGRIEPTTSSAPPGSVRRVDGVLSRGFFDLQVNGGGGVLLNSSSTPEGVRRIAAAHRVGGTTSLLPTVITDHPDVTRRAALAVLECHGQDGVRGIHIEGPHINPARKGTHDPVFIRPLDAETLGLLKLLREHRLPVLLTLAPEMLAPGEIAALNAMGVVVSAGHSDATADQIEAALAEGLRAFTHLFNGMSQMTGREPGVVGAAILSKAWCGVIADGHHVDPRMLRLAFQSRPVRRRMFAVSDAMATWNGPDCFALYDETIAVREGRLVNRTGSLAGAHIDMVGSFRNLLSFGLSMEEALAACVSVPADLMKLEREAGQVSGAPASEIIIVAVKPSFHQGQC